ncbi:hypothetical protein IC757_07430 [Wenzhouxiangella sp. AB-CW3]|uniref:hypothetical protein n=1 Tax=Wenzhouxiangella sp. AB-CW3 TaxID=2771012 RepID=UPI00168A9C34|nr:hypothetical protein [Wenzhouxiangella sp. AB-CW3]QOC23932.1 hypothetical protein IC757_07430 [Wenzhouxiangella sp. AB-CW3]
MSLRSLLAGLLLLPALAVHGAESPDGDSSRNRVTAYYAHFSPERMLDILQLKNPHISGHSQLGALAWSYRLNDKPRNLDWELEGQVVQHFGRQDHQELNLLLNARWTRFPWDHVIDTSAVVGWGQSFATEVPPLEPRSDGDERSTRLLNYLLVELDFAPPSHPEWGLVLRLHHRSGVFGLYNGVNGGSNYIGAGIRYRY